MYLKATRAVMATKALRLKYHGGDLEPGGHDRTEIAPRHIRLRFWPPYAVDSAMAVPAHKYWNTNGGFQQAPCRWVDSDRSGMSRCEEPTPFANLRFPRRIAAEKPIPHGAKHHTTATNREVDICLECSAATTSQVLETPRCNESRLPMARPRQTAASSRTSRFGLRPVH